jgi:catechol 2,3-dioxygenase-like lactoylglutathione lyase family enzyme
MRDGRRGAKQTSLPDGLEKRAASGGTHSYRDTNIGASRQFISNKTDRINRIHKIPRASPCCFFPVLIFYILYILSFFMELEGIDHVAMSVRDVERAAQWYIDVLGFERRFDGMWDGVPVFIGKGTTALALFPVRERSGSSSTPSDIRILHLAMRASRKNFIAAQEDLKRRGIKFEFQDHEISHSIYFRDPDGHQLEITTYELK